MKYIVLLFGLLIIGVSLVMFVRPNLILSGIRRYAGTVWFHIVAIVVRLILGVAFIDYSDESRFPLVFQVLGVISVSAAALIAVLPRAKFEQFVNWVIFRFGKRVRDGALATFLFGSFLVYAVAV